MFSIMFPIIEQGTKITAKSQCVLCVRVCAWVCACLWGKLVRVLNVFAETVKPLAPRPPFPRIGAGEGP